MIEFRDIIIKLPVLLLNLDNPEDKFEATLCMNKEDVANVIFKDGISKNIVVEITKTTTEDNMAINMTIEDTALYKLSVSVKNPEGELGFLLVSTNGNKYTIVNDAQTLNALKVEYIKTEMIEKYTQILNMDTIALSCVPIEIKDPTNPKIVYD